MTFERTILSAIVPRRPPTHEQWELCSHLRVKAIVL
jgi:hypothetical protein